MSCIYWIYFKLWKEKEKMKDKVTNTLEEREEKL